MNGPTDQFVHLAHRSQDAVTTAVRTWSEAVQNYGSSLASSQFPLPNPQAAVDATFDLITQVLTQQREFATAMLDAGTEAGEAFAHAGEAITKAGTEAREAVTKAATDAGEAVTRTAEKARERTRDEADAERATPATESFNETPKRSRAERAGTV
jgi:hypothetical protein